MSASVRSTTRHSGPQTTPSVPLDRQGVALPAGRSRLVGPELPSNSGTIVPTERRLVVCIDGTSNQFSDKNTNVIELYSHIDKTGNQLTYYNSGIGTYARPSWRSMSYWKQVFYNKLDLAIAWNVEKVIIAAYGWLADNYKEGDKIFLFGFSRGAYQIGLIFSGNREQIPFAFELYANCQARDGGDDVAATFKETFSRKDVKVHFVGVWDTVSSVGLSRGKLLPLTHTCRHITHFRHALALDERRVKFLPECLSEAAKNAKEVWFAGTHSDIGGGNAKNQWLDRSPEALIWMMDEAKEAGLRFNPLHESRYGIEMTAITESLNWVWLLVEWLPLARTCPKNPDKIIYWPHQGRGRLIRPHQKIHASVLYYPSYIPKATWNDTRQLNWKYLLQTNKESFSENWKLISEGDSSIFYVLHQVRTMSDDEEWFQRFTEKVQDEVHANKIWEYGRLEFLIKLAGRSQESTKERVKNIIKAVVGINTYMKPTPMTSENLTQPPTPEVISRDFIPPTGSLKETVIPRLVNLLKCTEINTSRKRTPSDGVARTEGTESSPTTEREHESTLVCLALEILADIRSKEITLEDMERVMPVLLSKLRARKQPYTASEDANQQNKPVQTSHVEEKTLDTLAVLCSKGCESALLARWVMPEPETVQLLVPFLHASSTNANKYAMRLVANLTEQYYFWGLYFLSSATKEILDCMDKTYPGLALEAARAVTNLATKAGSHSELIRYGVIAKCSPLLSPESLELAQQAFQIIINLTTKAEGDVPERLLDSDVLGRCTALLDASHLLLSKEALHAIGLMLRQGEFSEFRMHENQSDATEAKSAAKSITARYFSYRCIEADTSAFEMLGHIKAESFGEDMIPRLISLIGEAELCVDALNVVLELIPDEYARKVLLDKGVIEITCPLLNAPKDRHEDTEALRVLKALALHADSRGKLANESNISAITRLLIQHHRASVAEIIAELASYDDIKPKIISNDVHVHLIGMIEEFHCDAAPQAMRAMAHLVDDGDLAVLFFADIFFEHINGWLEAGFSAITPESELNRDWMFILVQQAILVLVNVADHEPTRKAVISSKAITTLAGIACSSDTGIASEALHAIKLLAAHDDTRRELLNEKILTKITPLFGTEVSEAAFELLAVLADYEETKAEVSKRGVIAALEKHKERIAGELADRIQTIIDKAKPPKSQSGIHVPTRQQDDTKSVEVQQPCDDNASCPQERTE